MWWIGIGVLLLYPSEGGYFKRLLEMQGIKPRDEDTSKPSGEESKQDPQGRRRPLNLALVSCPEVVSIVSPRYADQDRKSSCFSVFDRKSDRSGPVKNSPNVEAPLPGEVVPKRVSFKRVWAYQRGDSFWMAVAVLASAVNGAVMPVRSCYPCKLRVL
jgi:hypothetical protein